MSKLARAKKIYYDEGLSQLLTTIFWYPHTRLRTKLPRSSNIYNGVEVPAGRLFDDYNPRITTDLPDYEEILIEAIEDTVSAGDSVVVIGGGYGASSVWAERSAGPSGEVRTYEGSKTHCELIERTAELNDLSTRITPVHGVVGEAIDLKESMEDAAIVEPEELPRCDVLVMDAQGAECEILENLEHVPSRIVVETHGFLGCPTETVEDKLEDLGYTVTDYGPAMQSRGEETMRERDVYVLTGKQ